MSDNVHGKSIRYQDIIKAGFCYVGQQEKCPKQGAPFCRNGSHLCYRCWTFDIRAMHGCYTKKINVCTTRSEDFEHYPDRDPLVDGENDEEYDDLYYDGQQDTPVDQQIGVSVGGASRRAGFQAPRRPTFGNTKQNGAGPSHRQHPMNQKGIDSGLAKRPRSDTTTVAEDDLKIKIVRLEYEVKLEKDRALIKEEARKNEKENWEGKILSLNKRVNELEKKNGELNQSNKEQSEEIIKKNEELEEKKVELEKKKEDLEKKKEDLEKKTVELELKIKENDDMKLQFATERQQLRGQNIDLGIQINNVKMQLHHLSNAKGIPTAANMNGQVSASAPRKVPYWRCKANGCQVGFSQLEMERGHGNEHLINVHGISKERLVNAGLSSGPGLSFPGFSSGSRPGNRLINFMNPGYNNGQGMSFPDSVSRSRNAPSNRLLF